jgi:amidase
MLCVAGLAGLPQVNMPWTSFDGAPVGLSLIGARGADEGVLRTARAVHEAMR